MVIGVIFEFSTEFMPFHAQVIETDWANIDSLSQTLFLGMMRTEAAGFLATAAALLFLLCIPFRKFEPWSYWAMTTVGVVEYLPTFIANYHVASVTNASPPWWLMLSLIGSLFLALIFATLGHKDRFRAITSSTVKP